MLYRLKSLLTEYQKYILFKISFMRKKPQQTSKSRLRENGLWPHGIKVNLFGGLLGWLLSKQSTHNAGKAG